VPFKFNRIQEHYYENMSVRDIKNKPRKIGFTTLELGIHYTNAILLPEYQFLALTYDNEEAEYMSRIIHTFHENIPEGLRPVTDGDSARSMSFVKSNSSIDVQTAGGRRKGRGRTPSAVLLDEFAQYDEIEQEEIYTAVVNSAPPHAPIRIQSTPKGIGNMFHSQFTDAKNGLTNWKPFFYAWMWLAEKHSLAEGSNFALPEDRGVLAYTEEEQQLLTSWNEAHPDILVGMDNIRWRRMKIREQGAGFKQEWPEDDVSCFLATTETVFPTEDLNRLVARAHEAVDTRLSGHWRIFRRPESGQRYVIGVDCGSGIVGRDNSAGVIGTVNGEVVGVIAGIYGETEFAQIITDAAIEYNTAFIINERQNAFTFQHVVLNNLGYRNIYRHRDGAGFKPEHDLPLGFPTTGGVSGNKSRLIEAMRVALQSDGFRCPDMETLRELVEYKRHKDGSYGAPAGRHDDRAMAAMLYLVGMQSQPVRLQNRQRAFNSAPVSYPSEVFS